MKFFLFLTIWIGLYCNATSQTTIFSENMGTPGSTTAITSYTGFQNYGTLTYTGSGDVRNTTVSSGYTGASGGGNVFLTNTSAGKNFQMEGINTSSCSSFTLTFGVFKSTTTSNGSELLVEVSTDGVTYSALTMPALPTGAGTATWYLVTITSGIPATANLRIRFTNTTTAQQFRIDDVILTGSCSANTITTGALSSGLFTWTCGGSSTGTVAFTSTGVFNSGNVYTAQLSSSTGSFASPLDIGILTSTANSGTINITIPSYVSSGTAYQVQVVSSSPAVTGSASVSFTITVPTCCAYMTGAILNSCDNAVAGCDEGDAEVMFFNSGSYSINVATLPTHVINYYGSMANYNSNSIDAYTGTFSANAATTSSLNSSTGCTGGFIDAAAAGTIPANSTFIMVPSTFCSVNYDFSSLCGAFSPIYVLYFGTTGWSSGGNLANHQAGSNPKYLAADFSSVSGSCSKEYYTYDAGVEATGNGSGVSMAQPVSTNSASPTNPDSYTTAGCTLPIILPVSFLGFAAEAENEDLAKLSFKTEEEQNIYRFVIAKSTDGANFYPIANINGTNTTRQITYSAYDNISENKDLVYYSLVEEDRNGIKKTLAITYLLTGPVTEIKVSQTDRGIRVKSPVAIRSIEIFSIEGTEIVEVEDAGGELNYQFDLSNIVKGFYTIRVIDINEKITIKKIIH